MTEHTFASACIAAGLQPEVLPPFSLSTQELPELGDRLQLNQFLRIVANTPAGHASPFVETEDGGFVVFVQSRKPVDVTTLNADLPQFTARLRSARESEVFNQWIQVEANRQFRDIPAFQKQAVGAR
jgi:hypothetical protein